MTLYAGVRLRARVHMPHPAPSPRRLHWRSNVAMSLHAALSHRFPSFGAAAISEAVALLVANDVLSLDDIRTAPDCSSWAGSEASGRARARARRPDAPVSATGGKRQLHATGTRSATLRPPAGAAAARHPRGRTVSQTVPFRTARPRRLFF